MNQNEDFSTTDLSLASTLYYLGFQLKGLQRVSPSKVSFIFEHAPKLNETINKFWRKELKVEPSDFLLMQRQLKSRIYQDQ